MVAVLALVASIVFGAVQRDAERHFALAERTITAAAHARAEAEFRQILTAAVPAPHTDVGMAALVGREFALRLTTRSATQATVCDASVAAQPLVLTLVTNEDGGALQCETALGAADLLRWNTGSAQFAYSADGRTWATAWPAAERFAGQSPTTQTNLPAPLVRLTLQADGRKYVWIERAGRSASIAESAPPGQAP